MTMTNFFSHLL